MSFYSLLHNSLKNRQIIHVLAAVRTLYNAWNDRTQILLQKGYYKHIVALVHAYQYIHADSPHTVYHIL